MESLRFIIYDCIIRIGYTLIYIGAKFHCFALLKCVPEECRDKNYKELLEEYSILIDRFKNG